MTDWIEEFRLLQYNFKDWVIVPQFSAEGFTLQTHRKDGTGTYIHFGVLENCEIIKLQKEDRVSKDTMKFRKIFDMETKDNTKKDVKLLKKELRKTITPEKANVYAEYALASQAFTLCNSKKSVESFGL